MMLQSEGVMDDESDTVYNCYFQNDISENLRCPFDRSVYGGYIRYGSGDIS